MHHARPRLELGADRAVAPVVVEVRLARLAGVVGDEPVHVRAHAGRCGAVGGLGRGDEELVVAVVVGAHGVLQLTRFVVDADRHVRNAADLTEEGALGVCLHAQVVDHEAEEAGRDRHLGVHEEPGGDGATRHDLGELHVAPRPPLTVVDGTAEVEEVVVGAVVDGVQRACAAGGLRHAGRARVLEGCRGGVEVGRRRGGGPAGAYVAFRWHVGLPAEHVDRALVGELVDLAPRLDLVVGVDRLDEEVAVGQRHLATRVVEHRGEAVVAVDGALAAELDAHDRSFDAVLVVGRVEVVVLRRERRQVQHVAVEVASDTAGRSGPGFGRRHVAGPAGIGRGDRRAVIGERPAAPADAELGVGAVRLGDVGTAGLLGLPQLHSDPRDAGLPIVLGCFAGVDLVAEAVVGDRTDDAAALAGSVRLHAPVEPARQAQDRQDVDVDLRGVDGRLGRLVVGLVGDAGGLVPGVERLDDHELAERVHLAEVVPAVLVRDRLGGALILQRVGAAAHRDEEVRHALLAGVAAAVAVVVEEDGPGDLGEPARQGLGAHVAGLARLDGQLVQGEDAILGLVPHRDLVGAIGHSADLERSVRIGRAGVDGLVVGRERATREARQRDPTVLDGAIDPRTSGTDLVAVVGLPADRGRVDAAYSESAFDRPGEGRVDGPGWSDACVGVDPLVRGAEAVGAQVLLLDEAEVDPWHALAAHDQLGVKASCPFLDPVVPVVAAFERGRLDPAGFTGHRQIWRHDGHGVAVGADVGDRHLTGAVADALRRRALQLAAGHRAVGVL